MAAEQKVKEEAKSEELEPAILTWDAQIEQIASNKDIAADKFYELEPYMMKYEATIEENNHFKNDIVNEYRAGTYLNDISDHKFMLTNILKSYVVEQNSDGALKDFAFDYFQNMKYTYRGLDAVESESVKSNEAQMNKSLAEIE